jgi:hypothetical protein
MKSAKQSVSATAVLALALAIARIASPRLRSHTDWDPSPNHFWRFQGFPLPPSAPVPPMTARMMATTVTKTATAAADRTAVRAILPLEVMAGGAFVSVLSPSG